MVLRAWMYALLASTTTVVCALTALPIVPLVIPTPLLALVVLAIILFFKLMLVVCILV